MGHKYMYEFEMDTELKGCRECPLEGRCSATQFLRKPNIGVSANCPLSHTHTDEHGCRHDGGIGWNPQGVWCGECTSNAGPSCPSYVATKTTPVEAASYSMIIYDPNQTSVEIVVDSAVCSKHQMARRIAKHDFLSINGHLLYLPEVEQCDSDCLRVKTYSYFTEEPTEGEVVTSDKGDYVVAVFPAAYVVDDTHLTKSDREARRYADLTSATIEAHRLSKRYGHKLFAPAINIPE